MTATDEQLGIVLETARTYLGRNSSNLVRMNAEDLAQEVCISFMRAAAREQIDNPAAWAVTAAKNLAINLVQRNREDVADLEDEVNQDVFHFVAEGMATSYAALVRQQAALLMTQLDDNEKDFITLVAMGYSHAEIAGIIGYANADTVKATLYRKRKELLAAAEGAGLDPAWHEHPRLY